MSAHDPSRLLGQADADRAKADLARRVERLLQQLEGLPTLSPVASRLLEIASADDADLNDLIAIIESDPALSARILGLCQRASLGAPRTIKTVRQAVVMLGLDAVRACALAVYVYELFESVEPQRRAAIADASKSEPPFDRVGYWRYCIAVACACQLVASNRPALGVSGGDAFVAGMIHGMGRLALDAALPRTYPRVLMLAESRLGPSSAVEREILGIDHHAAGKRLAERWKLPTALRDAVWLHGLGSAESQSSEHRAIVGIVNAGIAVARHAHIGMCPDCDALPEPTALLPEAPLQTEELDRLVLRLPELVADRAAVLGLDNSSSELVLMQSLGRANHRLARINQTAQQRLAMTERAHAMLGSVASVLERCGGGIGVREACGFVLASASSTFDSARCRMLVRCTGEDPWELIELDERGEMASTALHVAFEGRLPAVEAEHLGVTLATAWHWIVEAVGLDIAKESVLLPLVGDESTGLAAALLVEHRLERWPRRKDLLSWLIVGWGSALLGCARQERSQREQDRLSATIRQMSQLRDSLVRAESLAKVGRLAAGAAHEINTPLAVVVAKAEALASGADAKASAQAIVRAAQRASRVATALRDIAQPPQTLPSSCVVAELIRSVVADVAEEIGCSPDRVAFEVPGSLGSAMLCVDLVRTILSELVRNGLESDPSARVRVSAGLEPTAARTLVVRVDDTGPGMDHATLQHCMDPFVSRPNAGRRVGIGLTRAHACARAMGATLDIRSERGRGTTGMLRLTLLQAAAPSVADALRQRSQGARSAIQSPDSPTQAPLAPSALR